MDKEEAALDDVDSLAAKHGDSADRCVHAEGVSVYVAVITESLINLQAIFNEAAE